MRNVKNRQLLGGGQALEEGDISRDVNFGMMIVFRSYVIINP